jgi:hypothetical protein
MSIFSRLRKRAEDEGPADAQPSPTPTAPAAKAPPAAAPPAARPPEPRQTPSNAQEARAAAASPAPVREPVRAAVSTAPARGNIQSPTSGTIAAAPGAALARASNGAAAKASHAAAPTPGMVPARNAERPAAPVTTAAAARVPVAVKEPTGGSLDLAIAMALEESAPPPPAPSPAPAKHAAPTAADEAALRATFEELAVAHVAPVRSAMMEVRWGEAQASWLEIGRPALKSLRAMASEVGHSALVEALDGFVTALQKVLEPGKATDLKGPSRDTLLAAYAPLASCLPRAFELEGEHDRREPIVVRALLEQVAGLEPLMIDKLMAAGLGRLQELFAARADEIAVVTGIPDDVAAAVATRIQAFRKETPATLATIDPATTLRELGALVEQLRNDHAAFETVARGWSEMDRQAKKQLRRRREIAFLQITIALVRLGDIDVALRLPKATFTRRIDELERLVASRAAVVRKLDNSASAESGPHPAAA